MEFDFGYRITKRGAVLALAAACVLVALIWRGRK